MTLNEGLKSISKDHANLILTHYTWPRNKYIQMSCATKKIGNIDGVADGRMNIKVISTINKEGYIEDTFSRKEFKDKKFNTGWIILDNNTFAKRLMYASNGDNYDLKPEEDLSNTISVEDNFHSVKVKLSEDNLVLKFSQYEKTRLFTNYVSSLLPMHAEEINQILSEIDNALLPFEDSAILYFDRILENGFLEGQECEYIRNGFNCCFPNLIGVDEATLEIFRSQVEKMDIDFNDVYTDDIKNMPRTTASNLLALKLLNIQNELTKKKPKKKRFLDIFRKKK